MKLRHILHGLLLAFLIATPAVHADSLVQLPRQLAVDLNGSPRSGAKLYVYDAGTTTPRTTYTTAALSTPHANPVLSVSTGLFPAIYIDQAGGDYKLVLKDSAEVTLWTEDNIPATGFTQAELGLVLYPRTTTEIATGITPVSYVYKPGHVKRYGGTLNSATLQAALTANAGNVVFLSGGDTHTINTALTWPLNTHIRVDGDGTAILDASGAALSGSGHLVSTGLLGASLGGGLAGNVAVGAVSATLNSVPALLPGDEVILRNPTDASWNADRADYRQGEVLIVKSLSGAVVTFTSATLDSYASASCTLHKVTTTSSSIKGDIEWRGNVADTANVPSIYIKYGRGNVIDGLRFRNTTSTPIEFSDSFDYEVVRVDTGKYLTDAGSIQATGIIAGGQKAYIHDNVLHGDRHGASTGGGGAIVSRFIVFERNTISSRTAAAADFHGAAEFNEYRNNHIDGGINLSGARNKLIGNIVYPHATVTSLINMEAVKTIEHTIEGNRFHIRGVAEYVVDANAATDINANTTQDGTFRFHRNVIIDDAAADRSYLFIRNNGSTSEMQLSVIGNEVRKNNGSFYGTLLAASVVSGDNLYKLIYEGQEHVNTGFGIVSGVDLIRANGSLGTSVPSSGSPSFGTARFESCVFDFDKKISVATPGTEFQVLAVPNNNTFLPLAIAGRVDVDVTATNGDFLGIGVNAANRRVDFGAFANAAASSKHAKNSSMRFINSAELANQIVGPAEALSLMSVSAATDAATIANNIGGASQTITISVQGRMRGDLLPAP